jgi:polar amino acid transport system permease protein
MVPPYTGNAITLLKQTSLATLVTVPEMALLTQRIFSNNFKFIEPIFVLGMIYLAMTSVLLVVSVGVERAVSLKV